MSLHSQYFHCQLVSHCILEKVVFTFRFWFSLHSATLAQYMLWLGVSVHPAVHLSQVRVIPKWLNIGSCKQHSMMESI